MSVVELGRLKYLETGDHGMAITIAAATHDAAIVTARSTPGVARA
jgi:hypothetical protein